MTEAFVPWKSAPCANCERPSRWQWARKDGTEFCSRECSDYHFAFVRGAAVAFGLIGMAQAIGQTQVHHRLGRLTACVHGRPWGEGCENCPAEEDDDEEPFL